MAKWMRFRLEWLKKPDSDARERFNTSLQSKDHEAPYVGPDGGDYTWRMPIVDVDTIRLLLAREHLAAKFYLILDRGPETEAPRQWEYQCGRLSERAAEVVGVLQRLEAEELALIEIELKELLDKATTEALTPGQPPTPEEPPLQPPESLSLPPAHLPKKVSPKTVKALGRAANNKATKKRPRKN